MRKNAFYILLVFLLLVVFSCLMKQNDIGKNENIVIQEFEQSNDKNFEEKEDQNGLFLIKAYENGDINQVLHYLEMGIDCKLLLSDGKTPLLFDIYMKYENGDAAVEELFMYFLEYKKECFEAYIDHLYKGQTIGSYIAMFGSLDTLKKLSANKIIINSYKALADTSALFNVACRTSDYTGNKGMFLGPVIGKEKLERLKVLLDAGADVTLRGTGGKTIFHYFNWWPIDNDFKEILDIFIIKGADITAKDISGHSAIYYAIYPDALNTNYEAYIKYLQMHGVEVTDDDFNAFYMFRPKMIGDDSTEEFNKRVEKWENDVDRQIKLKMLEEFLNLASS